MQKENSQEVILEETAGLNFSEQNLTQPKVHLSTKNLAVRVSDMTYQSNRQDERGTQNGCERGG